VKRLSDYSKSQRRGSVLPHRKLGTGPAARPRLLIAAGVVGLTVSAAQGQLIVTTDTTQSGGTLTVSPARELVVSGPSDPLLTLTDGAATSGVQGVVIGTTHAPTAPAAGSSSKPAARSRTAAAARIQETTVASPSVAETAISESTAVPAVRPPSPATARPGPTRSSFTSASSAPAHWPSRRAVRSATPAASWPPRPVVSARSRSAAAGRHGRVRVNCASARPVPVR
jgi:hypothetical protein